MNQLDLYKKIIESCDEALRDAFIRRMEAAEPIAEEKIARNMEVFIPENEEKSVKRICRGVYGDMKPQMLALWQTLVRMNRGRQYAYFVKNLPELRLGYDKYLCADRELCGISCAEKDIADAEKVYKTEVFAEKSVEDVINAVETGKTAFGAVKTNSFYDTSWLYSLILDREIFVNDFSRTEDGGILVLISKNLTNSAKNKIITVAFGVERNKNGDLAQKVSVFSENMLNIEYIAVKMQGIADDEKKNMNIFFAELSGGDLEGPNTRAAFLQMEKEAPFFRILGCRESI